MEIKIDNATKFLKKELVLNHVSAIFRDGISYGIVGANGSGKTMLLRAVCGFLRLDEGTVLADERTIGQTDSTFIENAGVLIGEMTFQKSLTGWENLKILAQIKDQITDADIRETMKEVGIFEARNKKFGSYSLGMKQRLKIAQAIMEHPGLLVLDEPFNGLDKAGVEKIREVLMDYKEHGGQLLLTSHNERDIELLCDSVLEMDRGEICL